MPRTLFIKIFLCFGTVVFTVIFGTFLVIQLGRHEPLRQPRTPIDQAFTGYANDAAEIFEREGTNGLNNYLERIQRESNIRAFLFNKQLQELSGRRMPADAPVLATRTFETRHPEQSSMGNTPLLSRSVTTSRGGEYAVVAELLPPPRPESFFRP